MDKAEMQAELELVADVQSLNSAVRDSMLAGASRAEWRLRRAQIAALRRRIHTMRDRHLGGHTTPGSR